VMPCKATPNLYQSPGFKLSHLPDSIILHYTAMDSAAAAVTVLSSKQTRASAHLVVAKNGEVYQLAPFNYRTWHAGISSYNGRSDYNQFSIGIEMDNLGWLEPINGAYSRKELIDQGIKRKEDEVERLSHKNPRVRKEFWDRYPPRQLQVVSEICKLLVNAYGIREILGHDDIAPERKQDPGPGFPMVDLIREVFSTERYTEDVAPIEGSVTASRLNIRSGPDELSGKVALPLPMGAKVKIMEQSGGWYRVKAEIEGWVNSNYIS
jgi:N-acetylmuramoyl-L-alanine amidase